MEKPKSFTAKEIGAPVNPEAIQEKELFKATLGFDFVFSEVEGVKRIFCIEINGEFSGIAGIQDIPKEQIDSTRKIMADARYRVNPELERKIDIYESIRSDLASGLFNPSDEAWPEISDYMKNALERTKRFKHSHENPDIIEKITKNKKLQSEFIPDNYRIKTFTPGGSLESSTGYWIAKPKNDAGGNRIAVLSNKEFESLMRISDEIFKEAYNDEFIVQEFIPPLHADNASEEQKSHAASLRLLIDFRYLEDDSIDIEYETAYQRIAITPIDSEELGQLPKSALVVNKKTGASSVSVSAEEFQMAHQAAIEIIHNLAPKVVED